MPTATEQSLVGACMLEREHLVLASAELSPDDIGNHRCRTIYAALLGLLEAGQPTDAAVLVSHLEGNGKLAAAGGIEHVLTCQNVAVVTREQVHALIAETQGSALLRRVRSASQISVAESEVPGADPATVSADSVCRLAEATQSRVRRTRTASKLASAEINAAIRGEASPALRTGFSSLSWDLLLYPEYTILGAFPGAGKSMTALGIATNVSAEHPVLMLSLQDTEQSIMQRLISRVSGLESWKIRRRIIKPEEHELLRFAEVEIAKRKLHIAYSSSPSSQEVQRIIADAVSRLGVRLVIVDYLSKIQVPGTSGNELLQHKRAGEMLDSEAGRHGVCIVALHHLRKPGVGDPSRRPRQADFRFGGDAEARACWALWRAPPDEGESWPSSGEDLELHVVKNNNGPTGKITLAYDFARCAIWTPERKGYE